MVGQRLQDLPLNRETQGRARVSAGDMGTWHTVPEAAEDCSGGGQGGCLCRGLEGLFCCLLSIGFEFFASCVFFVCLFFKSICFKAKSSRVPVLRNKAKEKREKSALFFPICRTAPRPPPQPHGWICLSHLCHLQGLVPSRGGCKNCGQWHGARCLQASRRGCHTQEEGPEKEPGRASLGRVPGREGHAGFQGTKPRTQPLVFLIRQIAK